MRLYVGNLKFSLTSTQLKSVFEPYGTVTAAQVLPDPETGQSRGFGFVEMADDRAGRAAIEGLDGQEVDGRRMNVSEAEPPRPRVLGRGGGATRGADAVAGRRHVRGRSRPPGGDRPAGEARPLGSRVGRKSSS